MSDLAKDSDPSAPLPRRHRRAAGGDQAASGNVSGQPRGPAPLGSEPVGQTSPPVRWTRQPAGGSPPGGRPPLDLSSKPKPGLLRRYCWLIASLAAVVVLSLVAAAIWHRMHAGGAVGADNPTKTDNESN